jgi:hypothetical protein
MSWLAPLIRGQGKTGVRSVGVTKPTRSTTGDAGQGPPKTQAPQFFSISAGGGGNRHDQEELSGGLIAGDVMPYG